MAQCFRGLLAVALCCVSIACGADRAAESSGPASPSNGPTASQSAELLRVTVAGQRFVDAAGRQLILHGINTGGGPESDTSWVDPNWFAHMHDWGFNVIRLQIEWSRLEPQCGKYDEDYLKKVDQQVAHAKANGLYVFLDMHQDLWGVKTTGDGAPEWATLDEGQPNIRASEFWQDGYFACPMVHKAFDNFYANKPGPDGVGIQDRFALAWQHVAKRYANDTTVIGYDLLNEPYPGSPMATLPVIVATKIAPLLAEKGEPLSVQDILKKWGDNKERVQIFAKLNDPRVLMAFLDAMESFYGEYERTSLHAMYCRVAAAIRKVDQNHLLLLEPGPGSITGVRSHLPAVVDAKGTRDPLQALVPHAYGLPFAAPTTDHMALILDNLADLSKQLNMPVILGEWWDGDQGPAQERNAMALFTASRLEKHLFGDAFWLLKPQLPEKPYFEALRRPFPAAVAGELVSYQWNRDTRVFRCQWKEAATATQPSRIYLPTDSFPKEFVVELTPTDAKYRREACAADKSSEFLLVDPLGQSVTRELMVRPAE